MKKTIPAFFFERDKLRKKEKSLHRRFRSAEPFPNVVVDGFLPAPALRQLVAEFPSPSDPRWKLHGPGRNWSDSEAQGAKLGISDEMGFGPFTRHFISQLNSRVFIEHLERITEIDGLITDPTYSGGGLHSTGRGGRLMIHADANRHPFAKERIHPVLNAILYLNPGWRESYGGHLELWNEQRQCVRRLLPQANRFVLFKTGTHTFHGHPQPLSCPSRRRRNSIAVYYYVLDRAFDETYVSNPLSPNWIATSKEDRDYAFWSLELFKTWLGNSHGSLIHLDGLKPPLSRVPDGSAGSIPILVFEASAKPEWRSAGLTAFGAVGARSLKDLNGHRGAILYYDCEGKLYLKREPGQAQAEFLFFVEPLLKDPVDRPSANPLRSSRS